MENIQEALEGWFEFKHWSRYRNASKDFEDDLSEFGTFQIYDNFKDFLQNNDHWLLDSDGELINIDEILLNEDSFNKFRESHLEMDSFNEIKYQDINKPVLYGEASASHEVRTHFISVDNIKDESDLIGFINDVLKDLGEVTHSTGLKNEYEVVKLV